MKNNTWVWIVIGLVLIMFVVGFWWWQSDSNTIRIPGYSATSTDSLQSSNVPPTTAVTPQISTGSVTSVIATIQDASRFAGLMSQTGVASQLTGKGPYTIFIPINEAFPYLPPGALNLSAAELTRMVEYHIISGKSIDVNVQAAGTVQALSKDTLNFSVRQGDKSARINSSVALQEFKASNGVVYLINQVLLPPTVATQ